VHYPSTRPISASVVSPLRTLASPSSRNRLMPCAAATWLISWDAARLTICPLISSVTGMTSNSPMRPRKGRAVGGTDVRRPRRHIRRHRQPGTLPGHGALPVGIEPAVPGPVHRLDRQARRADRQAALVLPARRRRRGTRSGLSVAVAMIVGELERNAAVRRELDRHDRGTENIGPQWDPKTRTHQRVRWRNVEMWPICRYFLESGRQDLNLRPPGPQPEGSGVAQLMGPVFTGFLASECVPVALSSFPVSFPVRAPRSPIRTRCPE